MSSPPQRRRRLTTESDSNAEGRRGCVTVGAVVGVLLGVVLGVFVLPGVLDSFLAGDEVAAGGTYSGDARVISVGAVRSGEDVVILEDGTRTEGTRVELSVTSRKTWLIEPEFFQLELEGRDDWVEALAEVASLPDSSLEFALGESRTLILQFEHKLTDGEPVSLHLSDPSIRLELASAAE